MSTDLRGSFRKTAPPRSFCFAFTAWRRHVLLCRALTSKQCVAGEHPVFSTLPVTNVKLATAFLACLTKSYWRSISSIQLAFFIMILTRGRMGCTQELHEHYYVGRCLSMGVKNQLRGGPVLSQPLRSPAFLLMLSHSKLLFLSFLFFFFFEGRVK